MACEFSGRVRDELIGNSHDAVSCDLVPSETPGPHLLGDARDYLGDGWDALIGFPPCTDLAGSGARHWPGKRADGRQARALALFTALYDAPIERVALENPVGLLSSRFRRPNQIIQPWQFGHGETKATCLWLRDLPELRPTEVVSGRADRIHRMPDSRGRARARSLTYPGIARAMADQWFPVGVVPAVVGQGELW